jgi:hypothetical protein
MVAVHRRVYTQADNPNVQQDLDDLIRWEFMFGAAFAHELCHAFVGFLAGEGMHHRYSYTPPTVGSLLEYD